VINVHGHAPRADIINIHAFRILILPRIHGDDWRARASERLALHNLRSSPFFQEALQSGEGARHPIDLFVGRSRQLQRHLAVIGSAGGSGGSSRQVIDGHPGVGKSSLAQAVKSRAAEHGYLSSPHPVALATRMTPMLLQYESSTIFINRSWYAAERRWKRGPQWKTSANSSVCFV
jgi:hypothetical protein